MSETEDKSKPKEKLLEEKEKVEAEVERSLAVAKMKAAHKEIEDIEKQRKRSALLSICNRIDLALHYIFASAKAFYNEKYRYVEISLTSAQNLLLNEEQTYRSIRTDFQKTLEIKEEDMQKLFPEIEIKKDIALHVADSLLSIISQLQHMKIYCERMLT